MYNIQISPFIKQLWNILLLRYQYYCDMTAQSNSLHADTPTCPHMRSSSRRYLRHITFIHLKAITFQSLVDIIRSLCCVTLWAVYMGMTSYLLPHSLSAFSAFFSVHPLSTLCAQTWGLWNILAQCLPADRAKSGARYLLLEINVSAASQVSYIRAQESFISAMSLWHPQCHYLYCHCTACKQIAYTSIYHEWKIKRTLFVLMLMG